MNAQDLIDGGAAQLGARWLNPDKVWWSYSQPTSGMRMTWSGVWYGQRGDGCGRRMRSPRGCPASVPLGEEHKRYILYQLQEVGPLGRIRADRWLGDRSMHVPIPALGTWVF